MKIKDNSNGVVRLEFSEINYVKRDQSSQFLHAIVSINVDDFQVKTKISAEITDFEHVLKGSKLLYKTLRQTFYFQHNDRRVEIKFAPDSSGHVNVSGRVRSMNYKASLDFEFYTDQTCFPEFIEELEKEIVRLNKEYMK